MACEEDQPALTGVRLCCSFAWHFTISSPPPPPPPTNTPIPLIPDHPLPGLIPSHDQAPSHLWGVPFGTPPVALGYEDEAVSTMGYQAGCSNEDDLVWSGLPSEPWVSSTATRAI